MKTAKDYIAERDTAIDVGGGKIHSLKKWCEEFFEDDRWGDDSNLVPYKTDSGVWVSTSYRPLATLCGLKAPKGHTALVTASRTPVVATP